MRPLLACVLLVACDAPRPPDLLLVSIDTLRADRLACYGYERPTSPFLDRVAAEGARCARAIAPASNTAPSHMSLFTGLDPIAHGVRPVRSRDGGVLRLDDSVATLPEVLRDAGWRTAALTDGGMLEPAMGFDRGWQTLVARLESLDAKIGRARALLAEHARDEPLFLFVHTYAVHAPYLPPRDLFGRFADEGHQGPKRELYERLVDLERADAWTWKGRFLELGPEASGADLRFLSDLYDECILHADRGIERLWEAWGAARDPDRTLLVVLSDHGEEFGEHGRLGHRTGLHRELIHVPLLIRGPGIDPGVIAPPVSLTDVAPTLLELLGVDAPPMTGRSFASLARGEASALPRVAISQLPGGRPRRDSIVADGHHAIRQSGAERSSIALYDWAADPLEANDVAVQRAGELARLREVLEARSAAGEALHAERPARRGAALGAGRLRELEALGYLEKTD